MPGCLGKDNGTNANEPKEDKCKSQKPVKDEHFVSLCGVIGDMDTVSIPGLVEDATLMEINGNQCILNKGSMGVAASVITYEYKAHYTQVVITKHTIR